MKKIILGSLALAVSSAFAGDVRNTVTGVGSSALSAEQQIQNANGSCDSGCSITTTFPGAGTASGTTLLSQAVNNTETQTITCVAAGHPATWTGSATQTRSFTSQNGVRIAGTETGWVLAADSCVAPPPPVVAPFTGIIEVKTVPYSMGWCGASSEVFCSEPFIQLKEIKTPDGVIHRPPVSPLIITEGATDKRNVTWFCANPSYVRYLRFVPLVEQVDQWRCN